MTSDRLQLDMADWISNQLWDGHEAECSAFGFRGGECNCIKRVTNEWRKERRLEIIRGLPELMDLKAENDALKHEVTTLRAALTGMGVNP